MKLPLLSLGALVLFTSCAGVRIHETQVASGATDPRAIYIRPFDVTDSVFVGDHRGAGEEPIRRSLAPHAWSLALKNELEKIAPTTILKDGEEPPTGWVVDGTLDVVDAGEPVERAAGEIVKPFGFGRSQVMIHVRISDVTGEYVAHDDKDTNKLGRRGDTLYEFDLKGDSRLSGAAGSIHAPGLGYAVPFDFKNAAERVMIALSTDAWSYGERTSPGIR
jgi:hypothetical protein